MIFEIVRLFAINGIFERVVYIEFCNLITSNAI